MRIKSEEGQSRTFHEFQGIKILLVIISLAATTFLHYFTEVSIGFHIFYQGLYFIPVFLAGFWFGLRGGLATSLLITFIYLPFVLINWNGFSARDFNNLMEIGLYNAVGIFLGRLRDREQVEEKRRREAERLADMGKAVSGLAHDIKTPLIAIGGFCRLVQRGLKDDDPNRDRLNLAIEEVRRLENMVKEMLDFSRPLELHRSMEGIDRIVRESREITAEFAREKNVEIKWAPSGTLPLSSMDPMRMKQVVINLLINAIEASPAEETVTIASYQKGRELIVEVLDNGQGISPDKKEEIFLPFFTTKIEGTGLGLSIAKKIVEAHQGRLELLDDAYKGATFRVAVPIE